MHAFIPNFICALHTDTSNIKRNARSFHLTFRRSVHALHMGRVTSERRKTNSACIYHRILIATRSRIRAYPKCTRTHAHTHTRLSATTLRARIIRRRRRCGRRQSRFHIFNWQFETTPLQKICVVCLSLAHAQSPIAEFPFIAPRAHAHIRRRNTRAHKVRALTNTHAVRCACARHRHRRRRRRCACTQN